MKDKSKLPKTRKPLDFDQAMLHSQLKDWEKRASAIQEDVKKNYMVRMNMMVDVMCRWIAYNELTMEDYKSFHPDAKEEGELEHLLEVTKKMSEVKYEELEKYVSSLIDFFNFVRGRLVQVNQGDKVMPQFMMSDTDVGKLVEKIKKIDDFRKNIP